MPRGRPDLAALQRADASDYLPNDILTKVDRMTMAHGLEARAPFLIPDVAEFGLTLPERSMWLTGSPSVRCASITVAGPKRSPPVLRGGFGTGGGAANAASDIGRAGEGDLVDIWMAHKRLTNLRSFSRQAIDDARR